MGHQNIACEFTSQSPISDENPKQAKLRTLVRVYMYLWKVFNETTTIIIIVAAITMILITTLTTTTTTTLKCNKWQTLLISNLHNKLMSSCNKSQAICVIKSFWYILSKGVSSTTWWNTPTTPIIWVTP